MPATLSAANKLRNKVLSDPNTVLLVQAGGVDKVLKVVPLPKHIVDEWGPNSEARRRSNPEGQKAVVLNLDNGPQNEAWQAIEREIFLRARRDRETPKPREVAPDSRSEWELDETDVPTVALIDGGYQDRTSLPEKPEESGVIGHKCDFKGCDKSFAKERALQTHKMHHERAEKKAAAK